MIETYVWNGSEVKKTGRTAIKKKQRSPRRRPETTSLDDTLYEITPIDSEEGTWKKWVDDDELYEVIK